jgi:hypothetical protein
VLLGIADELPVRGEPLAITVAEVLEDRSCGVTNAALD